jgi:MYXO-CTERM domain-containing protein
MRLRFAVASLFAVLAAAPTAHAAPLLNTFGGEAGFGTNIVAYNDDGSSPVIDITPAFPGGLRFFGGPYMTGYVNNNGNITFAGPLGTYTPDPFPVASRPMIAPYWADVDTRGMGRPARNGVYWHLEPGRMIVTWHNVGYYSTHDDLIMDFQLIITNALDCRSGDFDVEFRFNTCQWETGDASGGSGGFGGTPAQSGFDAGNGVDFVEIMGSRMAGISRVMCDMSNVGEAGVWRFGIRGGEVSCPGTGEPCDTGMPGACGVGVTQCVGRDIVCSGVGTPTMERCDGVDNDCNSMIDDGDLCPAPTVCDNGACVPPCFEGGCPAGETCDARMVCIDTECIGITCAGGGRCRDGVCINACEGVVCPHDQQCVAGRCTTLCDVLTCGPDEICVDGGCVARCPCRVCGSMETCTGDGACIPFGCDIVLCDPGFHCEGGTCMDSCAGAVCPAGQHCEVGECVDDPPPPDAGPPPGVDGGPIPDAGPPPGVDTGPVTMVDAGGGGGGGGRGGDDGCGCTVPASGSTPLAWGWIAALVLGWLFWRRRSVR